MPGLRPTNPMLILLLVLTALASQAVAQIDTIELQVNRDFIGVGGHVSLGQWLPLRLTLKNRGAENRPVICRWLLNDYDGDRLAAERRVTLNPQRTQFVWLYAPVPVNMRAGTTWTLQVVDAESEALLASQELVSPDADNPRMTTVGVCSAADLGLGEYDRVDTQHEAVRLVRGLTLSTLPDRWFGLASLRTLVWTAEGGDPLNDPAAPALEVQQAVRQWVQRGGHLVVVLPTIGQTWTSSPLRDLLPVSETRMRRVEGLPPIWMGTPNTAEQFTIQMTVFDVDGLDDVAVVLRNRDRDPTVVAGRFGFGRVTLVGVDLADRNLVRRGLPNGRYRLWNDIFHWQSPVLDERYVQEEIQAGRFSQPTVRDRVLLDRVVPPLIAMRKTAAPALLGAILVFGLYWLAAGPISFMVLKRKNELRQSWLTFVAVVGVFVSLCWGGAYLLKPRGENVAHLSVVDMDGRSGQVHTRSWLSLFVPRFDDARIELDPEHEGRPNTLANVGLMTDSESAGFFDPQSYQMDAASPNRMDAPMRATAKQLSLDYVGQIDREQPGLTQPWVMPQGDVRIENFWPVGRLSHGLPGTLRDVLAVYCPGDDQTPWVWRVGKWPAKEVLELTQPKRAERLISRPTLLTKDRNWDSEGFLGQLIGQKTGWSFGEGHEPVTVADNVLLQAIEMMSFYDTLPPPNFLRTDFQQPAVMYERTLGRAIDLTPLIAGRRIILIGYLEQSPLPAPLTVDGSPVDAQGWTVVRWIYDL